MILQNFKLSEDRSEIIGISKGRLGTFLRQFAQTHSTSKMYCIKIIEVNHSQLARNYLFAILGSYADELGYSTDNLEKIYLKKLEDLVRSGLDDLYNKQVFFDKEVVDRETGELLEPKLKSISKWSNTAMARFIDLVTVFIKREMPEFKIIDPSEYLYTVQGKKNEILFPNESIKL